MLNQGGRSSTADRREVDLYVDAEHVDTLFASLRDRVAESPQLMRGPLDAQDPS